MDTLSNIILYAENHIDFLSENFLVFEIPSKSTIARVLSIIDGDQVGELVINLMKERLGVEADVIAVDGKAIHSTNNFGDRINSRQLLTVYLTNNAVVLGQKSIDKKTNEIPVFQEMLDLLEIKNKTITADALHCQKETCKKITEKGGTYLLGLKQNQHNLYKDVKLFFDDNINSDCYETHVIKEQHAGRY